MKAEADEPIFVLRANDETAPACVREWAHRYGNSKCENSPTGTMSQKQTDKFREALQLARQMEEWYRQKNPGHAPYSASPPSPFPTPPHTVVCGLQCWCGQVHA